MPEYKNFAAMKGIFDDLQDYGTCGNGNWIMIFLKVYVCFLLKS